ncbi:MAG: flagellar hook-length control protein FliK [Nitrospiraceae bacterium]|nr:MAG: flagellar hook-length control protein FliK [Nitrospiraceae bacterium]
MNSIAPAGQVPCAPETGMPRLQGASPEMENNFGIFLRAEMNGAQQQGQPSDMERAMADDNGNGEAELISQGGLQAPEHENHGDISEGTEEAPEECAELNDGKDEGDTVFTWAEGHGSGTSGTGLFPEMDDPAGISPGEAYDPALSADGPGSAHDMKDQGTGPLNQRPVTVISEDVPQNLRAESERVLSPDAGEGLTREETTAHNQGELAGDEEGISRPVKHAEGETAGREAGQGGYQAARDMTSVPVGSEGPSDGSSVSGAKNTEPERTGGNETSARIMMRDSAKGETVDRDGGNRDASDIEEEGGQEKTFWDAMASDDGLSGEEHHEDHLVPVHTTRDRATGHGRSGDAVRHQTIQSYDTEVQGQEAAAEGTGKTASAGNPGPAFHHMFSRNTLFAPEGAVQAEGIGTDAQGPAPHHSTAIYSGDARIAEHPFTAQSMKMDGIRELMDSIVYVVRGSNKLGVTVEDRNFGRVDISLSHEKGLISVHVNTSDRVLREFMENNIQSILDTLHEEGISVGEFTVALREQGKQEADMPFYGSRISAVPEERVDQEYGRTGLVNIFA